MSASNLRSLCWLVLLLLAAASTQAQSPRAPWTGSRLQGSPEPPPPYTIRAAFPHRFQRPTTLLEMPGEGRMLVAEQNGRVLTFAKAGGEPVLMGDLRKSAGDGVALFGAALHPAFSDNRQLLLCYVHPGEGRHTRVSRFELAAGAGGLRLDSEQVLLRWKAGGHNAGCLQFGTDGMLYIATGDGSGPNPPDGLTTGQDISDLLGAILRIDVDSTNGDLPYAIPPDNPFVGREGARGEVWAYGLRNPWKFGVDSKTGDIFVADNGWESWELIHRLAPGANCGWPVMEGRAVLRSEVPLGPTPIRPPIKDHPHSEANSVIGGPVYRGDALPELDGYFIYGDYITGTIWAVDAEGENRTLVDTDQRIVAFAQGTAGELFVVDYDFTGQIYELLRSDEPDTSQRFPRRLSETGLFTSTSPLEPAAGVAPYDVRVPRWMDGAVGRRWIAIPGRGQATLSSDERHSEFPEGTVLVKHLTLPREGGEPLPLETQLLHRERGTWRPYSYLWDERGEDAQLVASLGAQRPLSREETADQGPLGERTWHVSATNECRLCHNAGAGFVLGFVPNQLDRPAAGSADQLALLAAQGVATGAGRDQMDPAARLVDPHDGSQSLDDRARSYLHANCSMCHHPGGNAIVSFYLRRELPFDQLLTDKGTGIGTFGMRNAKLIVPGDPYRSVLMYRMSKLGYGRMPYIGSRVVDSHGVVLIHDWIRQMSDEVSDESSPPLVDSPERRALQLLDQEATRDVRDRSIHTLTDSTEGSLALLAMLHGGRLDGHDRETAVAIGAEAPADRRGLFETFLPESQRRPTLGSGFAADVVLELEGDSARGKLIYFSDNARCRSCHDATDSTKSLGPTLAEINKKYPRRSELLQHVMRPSEKIDDKFAGYIVQTDRGEVLSGLLLERTDEAVVIQNAADKRRIRIASSEVARIKRSDKSIMPERLLSDLTPQEAADLLAYLRSLSQ